MKSGECYSCGSLRLVRSVPGIGPLAHSHRRVREPTGAPAGIVTPRGQALHMAYMCSHMTLTRGAGNGAGPHHRQRGEATRIMMALTHFGGGKQHFLLATPYISRGKAAKRRGHQ